MLPAFLDFNTFTQSDGSKKYYTMPWMQGPVGIVVNNNLWKDEYGKFPNTTDDFAEFCNMLKNKGVTPFIYSLETSYWDDIYSVWMAQYDGQDGIKSFYDGYASYYHVDESGNIVEGVAQNGEETPRYVPEMMLDQGLREALGVLENILLPEKGIFRFRRYYPRFYFGAKQVSGRGRQYFDDAERRLAGTGNGTELRLRRTEYFHGKNPRGKRFRR